MYTFLFSDLRISLGSNGGYVMYNTESTQLPRMPTTTDAKWTID